MPVLYLIQPRLEELKMSSTTPHNAALSNLQQVQSRYVGTGHPDMTQQYVAWPYFFQTSLLH